VAEMQMLDAYYMQALEVTYEVCANTLLVATLCGKLKKN